MHTLAAMQSGFWGTALAARQPCPPTTSRAACGTAPRVMAVAAPSRPPVSNKPKRSKVELVKEESNFLRHPLMEELVTDAANISEDAVQLMKFHGSYQQDNREQRTFGAGKSYQFMMRTRQPGGTVTNQLYLVMDELADLVRGVEEERMSQRPTQTHAQEMHVHCKRFYGED